MEETTVQSPPTKKTLGVMGLGLSLKSVGLFIQYFFLAIMAFYSVSGGPFGVEDAVSAGV